MSDFWLRKMRTYFQRIDFDKDGAITRKDFEQMADRVIATGELKPEQQEDLKKTLTAVWDNFLGVGGEAGLSPDAFIAQMSKCVHDPALKTTLEGPLPLFFHAVDTNNDGLISMDEFTHFYGVLGMDSAHAPDTFKAIDDNNDGDISLEEFMHNGTEFFFEEKDESKPSKIFWGPVQ